MNREFATMPVLFVLIGPLLAVVGGILGGIEAVGRFLTRQPQWRFLVDTYEAVLIILGGVISFFLLPAVLGLFLGITGSFCLEGGL